MTYVALLRGINVGGKAKVEMSRLKQVFEALGCSNVVTYINSGNIIFKDNRTASQLVPMLEAAIAENFGFNVRVLLRDLPNIRQLNQALSADWTNDTAQKTDVLFLWDEIDSDDIVSKILYKPDIEIVRYSHSAVIWNIARENATRGSSAKLVANELYKYMTIRNINTVRKIYALMQTVDAA